MKYQVALKTAQSALVINHEPLSKVLGARAPKKIFRL